MKMATRYFKPILFVFAYIPLLIALVIRTTLFPIDVFSIWPTTGVIIFGIIFTLLFPRFLNSAKETGSKEIRFKISESRNINYLTFIITYLLPFFVFVLDSGTIIALIIIYSLIACIYMNSALFSVNPFLTMIFGYFVNEITVGDEKAFLMTKLKLNEKEHTLKLKKIDTDLYLHDFEKLEKSLAKQKESAETTEK
jgi:hypothetical protein